MVSNYSSERSFSAFKRIKGALRSNMKEQKLNNITIMNIEADILRKVDFQHVVKEFVSRKCLKSVF